MPKSVSEAKKAESREVLRFMVWGLAVIVALLVAFVVTGGAARAVIGVLLIAALAVFNVRFWRRHRSRSNARI